jgi:hypothetical protein
MPAFFIMLVMLGNSLMVWPVCGETASAAAAVQSTAASDRVTSAMTTRPSRDLWAGWRGGPGKSGCIDGSRLPEVTRFAWRWPATPLQTNGVPAYTPVACLQETLYVAIHNAQQMGLAAMATEVVTPDLRWSTKPPETNRWFFATTLPPGHTVAASTDAVYFTDGRPGDVGRQLRCVTARQGRLQWQQPVAPAAAGELLLTESSLLASCREGELTQISTTGPAAGRSRWSTVVGAPVVGAPCLSQGVVLVGTDQGVVALLAATGQILWRQPVPIPALTGPLASADIAVVASAQGLSGLSLANGGILWTILCKPATQPLVADDQRILCTTTTGEILMTNWAGDSQCRWSGALPSLPPMLYGNTLLFGGPDTLQLVDLARDPGTASRWLATAWLGQITAPLLLSDNIVYFATAEKGLICARLGKP